MAVGGELGAGEEEDGEEVGEEDQDEGADMSPLRWSLRHCDYWERRIQHRARKV